MTRYAEALRNPNMVAFLHMIRVGEGTADPEGYRRHFGGRMFTDMRDHPRVVITAGLGKNKYSSTAAGAYQFLSRTWDECAKALRLPDFSESSQDCAAVFLIDRRKALAEVLAGDIEEAIRKCAREWASLPGSPYGQPVKTMAQALASYAQAGGVLSPADMPQTAPVAQPTKETTMPLPAIVGALLPALIQSIPKLGKLFGSGSEVAERNIEAAATVMQIVQEATGARNAQEAVESIQTDPVMLEQATNAINAQWYELTEAGGGGIDGAHQRSLAYAQPDGPRFWFNPAFWISGILLLMPFMLLVDVFYANPESYAGEIRTQIVTALLMVVSMVGAYWIGTSFSSARKTEIASRE